MRPVTHSFSSGARIMLVLCTSDVLSATVLAEDWLQVLLVPSYLEVCNLVSSAYTYMYRLAYAKFKRCIPLTQAHDSHASCDA